jgi:lysophospholipase L1-like esterase
MLPEGPYHALIMRWLDALAPELEYRGLVGDRRALVRRVPSALRDELPSDTWARLCMPSGVRIAFRTNSPTIGLRAEWLSSQVDRGGAIDIYLNGQFYSQVGPVGVGAVEAVVYDGPERNQSVELYMPTHAEIRFAGVGVTEKAEIKSPNSSILPTVVFYGDSITHGSVTARPGTTYPARVARALGVDFVNLGVGGSARGEPAMAQIIGSLKADVVVLAYGVNSFGSSFEEPRAFDTTYDQFLGIVRASRPTVPIVFLTPFFHTREFEQTTSGGAKLEEYRRVIREVVYRRQSFGDFNLVLVDGHSVIGPGQGDLLADQVHPNDQGFAAIAEILGAQVRRILSLL